MIKRWRHKATAQHRPSVFKWPRKDSEPKGHIKKLNPERDRSLILAGGVVAAMLVGGVFGWAGATLMKPDEEPQSPKSASMGMPQVEQTAPDLSTIAQAPHDPQSVVTPAEQGDLFTEDTLQAHPHDVAQADETAKLYEEPLPTEMEVSTHAPQIAALPPVAEIKSLPQGGDAPWLRNALPFTPQPDTPMIAIVIDDVGIDLRRSAKVVDLPGPLTLSYLSYARNVKKQVVVARQAGHELFLHMPMEPFGAGYDPGPDVLLTSMTPQEIRARLVQSLNAFDGYVGINNHMGSKFTADTKGMTVVMAELKKRGLLFLDSLTSGKSVAGKVASTAGVPNLTRHVFLDNSPKPADIQVQIRRLEKLAKKHGSAIAIGHPRGTTIQALQAWMPHLKEKGFQLVPLSTLAKIKYGIF